MKRVCHITNMHDWNDTRIFYKECCSLADEGYHVTLVAPNAAEGVHHGVHVKSVKNHRTSRLYRATVLAWKVMRQALKSKSSVIHFHDPELIWICFIMKLFYGKTIVFDVHENLTAQIQDKEWLKFKRFFAWGYGKLEYFASKYFHIVIAEESYSYLFEKQARSLVSVLNFPEIDKLKQFEVVSRSQENGILYVGAVSEIRGIVQIIDALAILQKKGVPFTFHCVGPLETGIRETIESLESYQLIKDSMIIYGRKPIFEAYQLAQKSRMALSILHPTPNYVRSYSTKIFEYMSIGLPFMVSNFPLYDFVKEQNIGSCVDPFDVEEIANEMILLLSDSEAIDERISRAKLRVQEAYSWGAQRVKLVELYSKIAH